MKHSATGILKSLPPLVQSILFYRRTPPYHPRFPSYSRKDPLIKLAGGAIRDILQGDAVKDYDIWVNCPYLYSELRNLLKEYPQIQEANLSYCSDRNSVSSYDCGDFGVDIILYNTSELALIETFDYPLNCHELFLEVDGDGGFTLTLNSHPQWDVADQFHLRSVEWLSFGLSGGSSYNPPERDVLRQKYLSDKFPQYNFHLY